MSDLAGRKTTEEQIRDEHSHYSNSKRVIQGPLIPAMEGDVNKAPIHKAINGVIEFTSADGLDYEKCYRFISNAACHIKFAKTGNANVSDIYIPANTAQTLCLRNLRDRISVFSPASGFVQLTELMKER